MILFKPEHVPKILDGTKTQTRRIWKKRRAVPGSIHQAKMELFGKSFARIKILKCFKEELGKISSEDVIKEGYRSKYSYMEKWVEINGSWFDEMVVYVVEFEVVKE